MLENFTPVRHKQLKYEGRIIGITKIKKIFTHIMNCDWQYRIECPDRNIRIAPEEDLEILPSEDRKSLFFLLQPFEEEMPESESFLMKLGYRITGKSQTERLNALINEAIPRHGVDAVVEILLSFMLARAGDEETYWNCLYGWNRDVNYLMERYAKDNAQLQARLKRMKKILRNNGYDWKDV